MLPGLLRDHRVLSLPLIGSDTARALTAPLLGQDMGVEANEGANILHDQNLILVILHIEKHNITEIIEN